MMNQKKENKPCNSFDKDKKKSRGQGASGSGSRDSFTGGAGNTNNGGKAGT